MKEAPELKTELAMALKMLEQMDLGSKNSGNIVPEETKGEVQIDSTDNLNGTEAKQSWAQPKVSLKSNKLAREDHNVNHFGQKTNSENRI